MTIADIGPAIAAGKRLENNRAKAQQLGEVPLSDTTARALDSRRHESTHVWFVLWGGEQVRLLLVADRFVAGTAAQESHVTVEGPERLLASFADGSMRRLAICWRSLIAVRHRGRSHEASSGRWRRDFA